MSELRELPVDEICWTPAVVNRLESVDLLTLDANTLFLHARDLHAELTAMRQVLSEALGTIARLTRHLDRQTDTVIRLHDLLRAQRRSA